MNTTLESKYVTEYIGAKRKKFGDAIVECHPEVRTPFRTDNLIMLPALEDYKLIKLPGQQTFFTWNEYQGPGYFGGTDESPFLSHLDWNQVNPIHWKDEGPEGFLNILKPKVTTVLENRLSVRSERQGDWFAIPLPVRSIEEGVVLFSLADALGGKTKSKFSTPSGNTHTLGGTRHELEGEVVQLRGLYIGRGTLRAPDHADQHFDGIHLFEQARAFYDKETARNAD